MIQEAKRLNKIDQYERSNPYYFHLRLTNKWFLTTRPHIRLVKPRRHLQLSHPIQMFYSSYIMSIRSSFNCRPYINSFMRHNRYKNNRNTHYFTYWRLAPSYQRSSTETFIDTPLILYSIPK